jgi:hypothetical protein
MVNGKMGSDQAKYHKPLLTKENFFRNFQNQLLTTTF